MEQFYEFIGASSEYHFFFFFNNFTDYDLTQTADDCDFGTMILYMENIEIFSRGSNQVNYLTLIYLQLRRSERQRIYSNYLISSKRLNEKNAFVFCVHYYLDINGYLSCILFHCVTIPGWEAHIMSHMKIVPERLKKKNIFRTCSESIFHYILSIDSILSLLFTCQPLPLSFFLLQKFTPAWTNKVTLDANVCIWVSLSVCTTKKNVIKNVVKWWWIDDDEADEDDMVIYGSSESKPYRSFSMQNMFNFPYSSP